MHLYNNCFCSRDIAKHGFLHDGRARRMRSKPIPRHDHAPRFSKVCLVSVFSLMFLFSFREYLFIPSLCYSLYCMYYWFFIEFSYRTGIFALSFLHWWLFANNAYLWCLLITSWNRKSRKYILSQHVYLYLTHSKKNQWDSWNLNNTNKYASKLKKKYIIVSAIY